MQLIFNKVSGNSEKVTINGKKVTERLNLKEDVAIKKFKSYSAYDPIKNSFLKIHDNRYIFFNASYNGDVTTSVVRVDLGKNDISIHTPSKIVHMKSKDTVFADGFKEHTFYYIVPFSAASPEFYKGVYTGDYETKGGFQETFIAKTPSVRAFCTDEVKQEKFYLFTTGSKVIMFDVGSKQKTEICNISLNIEKVFFYKELIYIITKNMQLHKLNLNTKQITQVLDFNKKFNITEVSNVGYTGGSFSVYSSCIFYIVNCHKTGEIDEWSTLKYSYNIDTGKVEKSEFYTVDNGIENGTVLNNSYFIANSTNYIIRLLKKIYE